METQPMITNGSQSAALAYTDMMADRTVNQLDALLTNPEVAAKLKEYGVSVDAINKTRIKNVLAAYAIFSIMRAAKNNLVKVGIVGVAGYLVFNKQEQLVSLYDKVAQAIA